MNSKLIINSIVFLDVFGYLVCACRLGRCFCIKKKLILKNFYRIRKKIVEKLNSINQVLDTQKSNVERLEQTIPSSEFKPELISIMESLANQNGLSLTSVNIELPIESGSVSNRRGSTAKNQLGNCSKYKCFWNIFFFQILVRSRSKKLKNIDINKILFYK